GTGCASIDACVAIGEYRAHALHGVCGRGVLPGVVLAVAPAGRGVGVWSCLCEELSLVIGLGVEWFLTGRVGMGCFWVVGWGFGDVCVG
ncbi:hypothetical protein NP570_23705, partial [Vibrio parahaemolyticus]|nr:hypothetical protein [Vibrio parahaemolyticus]